MDSKEFIKLVSNVIKVDVRNARIEANKKGVVHDEIRVCQVTRNAMGDVQICGMTQEIAAKEVPGLDAVGFQICSDAVTGEPGAFPDCDHVTEPEGIGVLRGPGQDRAVGIGCQDLSEFLEIFFALDYELLEFLQLGAADGSLHVRYLEVITDMAVNVFVVITERQGAELLAETFPAGVAFSPGTVTVPAPVTNGAGDAGQIVVIRGHAAPLSQGDVMGGVEGKGGRMCPLICPGRSGRIPDRHRQDSRSLPLAVWRDLILLSTGKRRFVMGLYHISWSPLPCLSGRQSFCRRIFLIAGA